MDTREYDSRLARLAEMRLEEWQAIPEEDVIMFTSFGTVAPEILRRIHRFVPPQ